MSTSITPHAAAGRALIDELTALIELGPPAEIVAQTPARVSKLFGLRRVVLTRVEAASLVAEAAYVNGDEDAATALVDATVTNPLSLEYPSNEGELLRRRRSEVVRVDVLNATRNAFAALGWQDYLAAPILIQGRVVGFLHADQPRTDDVLTVEDADALAAYGTCFALAFERATLHRRLRLQREEMRAFASWAEARSDGLLARAAGPMREPEPDTGQESLGHAQALSRLRDLLTRREIDVLELMVAGHTNAGIARELVVSEGTVKFHVKNVLRKLHANNRAEAISRYLRLTLGSAVKGNS